MMAHGVDEYPNPPEERGTGRGYGEIHLQEFEAVLRGLTFVVSGKINVWREGDKADYWETDYGVELMAPGQEEEPFPKKIDAAEVLTLIVPGVFGKQPLGVYLDQAVWEAVEDRVEWMEED
jgi:hypothetical protein